MKTKSRTKTPSAVELKQIRVSGCALAACLGIARNSVTQYDQQGLFKAGPDGTYPLVECILAFVDRLRKRDQRKSRNSLDDELQFWKTEKVKQQVKTWRQQRDRDIALAILDGLKGTAARVRDALKGTAAADALDALAAAIDATDLDRISDIVEGGEDDGEED
ncbi:MAG: hypothetical protein J5746_12175 [Victivallales bacterium]|nr:hypothetical protein [Victivallales bacterium]